MQTALAIEPFPYQGPCLTSLNTARRQRKKKALVVMATGLGKTITVAFDVKKWLSENSKGRILYLCHQNDILQQAREKFETIIGLNSVNYGYYHGFVKEKDARVLFASFQTMRRHMRQFRHDEFSYIIVDESHHTHAATYRPIVEYFRPKFILGVTATPDRADLKDIRDIFGKEVFSLNLPEALVEGLLTPVDYRLITDELIELSKIKNPYKLTLKELNKRLFIPRRDKEIVRIIRGKVAYIKNPRIMIFCSSIEHAERFCAHIPGSIPIHSNLPKKEQRSRLKAFREGLVSMAVTVDKFNEGIDIPEINVIVFLRSTQSNTIFHQQLGRGLRKVRGKKTVLVLDFVANCERIKMIHDLIEKINRIQKRKRKKTIPKSKAVIKGLNFEFTEKAMDILQILKQIRTGYSKQDLIAYLQILADVLGRSPTIEDISDFSKDGYGWSSKTFEKAFGSFSNAQRAAKLSTYRKFNYDKKDMINRLKILARKIRKPPGLRDIKKASKAGECPTANTYASTFGSINKALIAAGLPLNRKVGHSKASIIRDLKSISKKLGRVPTLNDIRKECQLGNSASPSTITLAFGTYNSAIKKSGLKPNRQHYSRQDLMKQLEKLQRRMPGRIIRQEDIGKGRKLKICASPNAFKKAFGSLPVARKAAGILS